MKQLLLFIAMVAASYTMKAQNLHVTCGGPGLQCDGREIVIHIYNPACGAIVGSTNPLVVWTGDDYTVNLAALYAPNPLPSSYEIYSVEVRPLSACSLSVASGVAPCFLYDGITVGDLGCTSFPNTGCFELSANCGPIGGVPCSAGQITNADFIRPPGTGSNVLLLIY